MLLDSATIYQLTQTTRPLSNWVLAIIALRQRRRRRPPKDFELYKTQKTSASNRRILDMSGFISIASEYSKLGGA